ncbi:hypothetical protein EV356DRAFT_486706 [Viridothelium virens]|uniref:Mitochondrial K+-H+ exchange-related-domain-containing protein n=1 Tax=Viridothelium virens TaxID=1048519 RepID=A0A6A6H6F0_VIRVR|nr:hypothetical protein EV356DRAFT_486706 [Viridothelium virens]
MRLFLLPISTRRTLIYCERVEPKLAAGSKPPLLDRVTQKVSQTWADWEKSEEKGINAWKKTVTRYGNAAFKRIPYEEWGLKSVPPLSNKWREVIRKDKPKIEVLFPGLFLKEQKVPEILEKLALERQPLHRQRMIWSAIGAPLTLPFALVPIIPNIPGFYLLFRAWSHYRAFFGARHLQTLLEHNCAVPRPSSTLDELYAAGLMNPTRQGTRNAPVPTNDEVKRVAELVDGQTNNGTEDVMLLQGWNGKLIAERFKLPEMEVEVERAVEQVEKSIKAKEELMEEKQEIEAATKPSQAPDTKK